MSDAKRTSITMPANVRSTGSQSREEPVAQGLTTTADENRIVAEWFSKALDEYGIKAGSVAAQLDVDAAHLSRMRSGEKSIALRHLLLFMGHREAVIALVTPLLESIGYAAMPRPKMSKRQAIETIAAIVRKNPTLRRAAQLEMEDAGIDADQVELAVEWGDVTGELKVS